MKTLISFTLALMLVFLTACTRQEGCIDKSKICDSCACIKIYDPVCGCNAKTYGNECEATNAGVTTFTKGKCK